MSTQYYSLPVPVATDYVKDGWDAIADLGNAVDSAVAIPTYNNQTGTTYTFVLTDAAKVVSSNNGSAVTFTVPPQSSVTWTTGATLTVVNYGAGAVTIAGGSGVTVTNTAATIAQYSSATVIRTGSDAWTVVPFAGGAAYIKDSEISATTGSPSTGTYTDSLGAWKFYKWTGSGSITFNASGNIDVLVIGGGGAGGRSEPGGGGAGGLCVLTQSVVTGSTHTVYIGAGGPYNTGAGNGYNGTDSYFGFIRGLYGGGGGGGSNLGGNSGGSGGASARYNGTVIGSAIQPQGNSGAGNGGGGGGAGGNGYNGTGGTGDGGIGKQSSITGSATYYGGGGGGGFGTSKAGGLGGGGAYQVSGTANTGGGGGGDYGNGGSGVVIIRVKQ